MTSVAYQKQHLKSLTGLRFLAALSVFIAHVPVRWPQFDVGSLPFGAAGVSFFYVLSGFILTYVYGSRMNGTPDQAAGPDGRASGRSGFSFQEFYLKRFARIWPLHFATLLISLLLVIGVQAFFNQPNPVGKLLTNGLFLQSWIPNYQWIYSLNGPSWSLSVEAFFYFVFPFLLLGGPKKFIGKYLLIIVATFVALLALGHLVPQSDDAWVKLNAIVHANPLMRLFEFATGVGCGFLYLNRQSKTGSQITSQNSDSVYECFAVGILILFFLSANWLGMYGVENKTVLPIGFWYWFRFCGAAPVFALVVLTFAKTDGLISSFVASRLMVYLGEISYSFYMIHMGVMLILVRQDWVDDQWVVVGTVICSLLISVCLASALYHLVELPFRRAIVDWFDGKGMRSVFRTVGGSVLAWIGSPWFVPIVVLAIGNGWFVSQYRFDIRDQDRIDAIVSLTDPEIQNAQFEQDATLLGLRASRTDDGGLSLEMVWRLNKGRRTDRFIKLLDGQQKVIGRGNSNRQLFDHVLGDDVVIDRIRLAPEKMTGVQTIAIGFYDAERKTAAVDRGPRSARDRQLHVWVAE